MSSPFTARHPVLRFSLRISLAALAGSLKFVANVYAVEAPLTLAGAQRRAMDLLPDPILKVGIDNLPAIAKFVSDISVIPAVALRLLYCRWLN
ncbi:MAG: hypothetical protein K2Y13_05905 [Burkholderiaceae bacterium]|uniref:Uncharacterized protein n=1 Tax=Herminiimonas contaminans TaxID=1111140 RepID=A0ABS0EXU0_9BURK|nr:hypothetical protein [Herminiimonas contaminans]MBF8179641.1 hypothetical protein [Herminiimonas contaminans]MBX9798977.1 hypothetical protein [Burkholderiaceae bacterium]